MNISVTKSANEVAIGSLQITNKNLAKLVIRINDIKNNLKKRRHAHWVKVSFKGTGSIELGDEPMCIGDYDEYSLAPEIKVIIPIEQTGGAQKQYICNTLNTPILFQNKSLTKNEKIIILYTKILSDTDNGKVINKMLLSAMKKCLFEYQMKAYSDYSKEPMDRQVFEKRIQQIINILPKLDVLIASQHEGIEAEGEPIQYEKEDLAEDLYEAMNEGIKEDIEEELYGVINQELEEDIEEDLHEAMNEELEEDIAEDLYEAINEELKEDIEEDLHEAVNQGIEEELKEYLYQVMNKEIEEIPQEDLYEVINDQSEEDLEEELIENYKEVLKESNKVVYTHISQLKDEHTNLLDENQEDKSSNFRIDKNIKEDLINIKTCDIEEADQDVKWIRINLMEKCN